MPITRTPMIDDDGSGTTGTIINNSWKQELYGQIDGAFGQWDSILHSEVSFLAAAGAWTVPAGGFRFQYAIVGKMAFFLLVINNSALSAVASGLAMTLPARVPVPFAATETAAPYFNAGAPGTGLVQVAESSNSLGLVRDISNTPWQVDAGGTFIRAQFFYQIF